jgi:hypothetical protein
LFTKKIRIATCHTQAQFKWDNEMKNIETVIHIHSPLHKVWNVLMDFDSYPSWNPFVRSIQGDVVPGRKIDITLKLPGNKEMDFKPEVLTTKKNREFRWKGKLLMKGLFDGEHYFILSALPNGSTSMRHGEQFSGILPPIMPGLLKKTKLGFQNMNIALKERCENPTRLN